MFHGENSLFCEGVKISEVDATLKLFLTEIIFPTGLNLKFLRCRCNKRKKYFSFFRRNTEQMLCAPKKVWPSRAKIRSCTGAFPFQMSPLSRRLPLVKPWCCLNEQRQLQLIRQGRALTASFCHPSRNTAGLNAPVMYSCLQVSQVWHTLYQLKNGKKRVCGKDAAQKFLQKHRSAQGLDWIEPSFGF